MRANQVLGALAAAVVLAAGTFAVGALHPPQPETVQGDTLGPFNGEPAEHYASRAAASLAGVAQDDAQHFALLSFATPLHCPQAAATLRGRAESQRDRARRPGVQRHPGAGGRR